MSWKKTKKPGQPGCKGAKCQKLWSNEVTKGPKKEAFFGKGWKGGKGATCDTGRFGQKLEDFELDTDGGILEGIATKKVAKRQGARFKNKDMLELDQGIYKRFFRSHTWSLGLLPSWTLSRPKKVLQVFAQFCLMFRSF